MSERGDMEGEQVDEESRFLKRTKAGDGLGLLRPTEKPPLVTSTVGAPEATLAGGPVFLLLGGNCQQRD
jgi:hypothetical protein